MWTESSTRTWVLGPDYTRFQTRTQCPEPSDKLGDLGFQGYQSLGIGGLRCPCGGQAWHWGLCQALKDEEIKGDKGGCRELPALSTTLVLVASILKSLTPQRPVSLRDAQ